MKKLLVLIAFCSVTLVMGQNATKQVADSACVCLKERMATVENENFRDTLNKCVAKSVIPLMTEVMEEQNVEGYTVENIRLIQSKIIAVLKEDCEVLKETGNKKRRSS